MIPKSVQFVFIVVPLTLFAVVLVVVFVAQNSKKDSNTLSEQSLMDISKGDSPTDYKDFEFEIITEGSGSVAANGDVLVVDYEGKLKSGRVFDSSYERGEPFEFTLGNGEVIEGWEEGIAGMRVGEKRVLYIPSSMGYGADGYGSIPGSAGLQFTVELIEIL